MPRKNPRYPLLALVAALAVGACGQNEAPRGKPVIAVTVLPQAYFVERLAGPAVDVMVMIPPGASEAAYEPTMDQLIALERAALYVKIGHPHFEFEKVWLDKLLASNPKLRVFDISAGAPRKEHDPHVWTSPRVARVMSENLARVLGEIAPEAEPRIRANLAALLGDIDALDAFVRKELRAVKRREFIVVHPSWGYLAEDYGLTQLDMEHGSKEATPEELKTEIDHARATRLKVVFVQPQFSRVAAEVVAKEIGGRVVSIDPLGRDWLASMRNAAREIGKALSE